MFYKKNILFILLPLTLLFLACENSVVSHAEYDALLSEKQEIEAINDSLQFELSCLRDYVEHLEEDNDELTEEIKRTP